MGRRNCVSKDYVETVEALVLAGADPDKLAGHVTPMQAAWKPEIQKIMRVAQQKRAALQAQEMAQQELVAQQVQERAVVEQEQIAALFKAVKEGNVEAACDALMEGVDVDVRDMNTFQRFTPLMHAAIKRSYGVVELLLDKKAIIDADG